MHGGSIVDAAKDFGTSKALAFRYLWQVFDVIIICLRPKYIVLPITTAEWKNIGRGFEQICGFPDCCFAVDGCLFEIERPYDYEDWYCRKGYPAINA